MPTVVHVSIHQSQFPERVLSDLRASLRSRQVNHKFHYDSYKQTQQWLELHQACSPSRTDRNCMATYDLSFVATATRIQSHHLHLIGLGCGGGQKDSRLLRLLTGNGKTVHYTPVDVSLAMVLVAQQAANKIAHECHPFVCDLSSSDDLPEIFEKQTPLQATRLLTFFGMMPNFEPSIILPKLKNLVRRDDHLLLSANLAPGEDYAAGVRHVLPLYANALTSGWLFTFLLDLGVERTDGEIEWSIENCPHETTLLRITAWFRFDKTRVVQVGGETFPFCSGNKLRLFFSYRYTPDGLRTMLAKHDLAVQEHWITASEEEGVFLCRRS